MSTKKPCDCCETSCVIFQKDELLTNQRITDFDVISGSWGTPFGNASVTETTGSGIALARARTDGAGTELIAMDIYKVPSGGLVPGDATRYDLVFDWIDGNNYQVLKWRGIGLAARPTIARIASGVETDLVTLADCAPDTQYYFVRNSSPAWLIYKPAYFSRAFFDEVPQYGGTRFGVRSNNSGGTEYYVRSLSCYNTVDSAIAAIHKPIGYPSFAYSDAAKPGCLLNPDNARCDKCIAWGPRSGEAQWVLTIDGVTGGCSGLLNGSHVIECNGCDAGIYYNDVNCSSGTRHVWITIGLGGYGSVIVQGVNPSMGARSGYFPFADPRILNCYTDWPQTLWGFQQSPSSPWDPADADFSSATATLDLVF